MRWASENKVRFLIILLAGELCFYGFRYVVYPPSVDIPQLSDDMSSFSSTTVPTSPEIAQKKQEFRDILRAIPLQKDGQIPINIFEDNYSTIGPDIMIDVLDEIPLCHAQAHNLGRVIYEHTKDLGTATAMCQAKCADGCIHGVLMGMFHAPVSKYDPSPQEITPALKQEIANACDTSEITRYTGHGNCFHAVGHAIAALVYEDVPKSLDLCNTIYKTHGLGALYYCATGVYMQEDITAGVDDAKSGDRGLYPCDTAAYPAACYRYKMHRLFNLPAQYAQAIQLCLSLSGTQQAGCFHGLGFAAYSMVYRDPAMLNLLCGSGDALDKRMCLEGVLPYINVANPDISKAACAAYTAGDATMCTAASSLANFSLKRDFTLYTQ
jgi:hypothetical protein